MHISGRDVIGDWNWVGQIHREKQLKIVQRGRFHGQRPEDLMRRRREKWHHVAPSSHLEKQPRDRMQSFHTCLHNQWGALWSSRARGSRFKKAAKVQRASRLLSVTTSTISAWQIRCVVLYFSPNLKSNIYLTRSENFKTPLSATIALAKPPTPLPPPDEWGLKCKYAVEAPFAKQTSPQRHY